MENETDNQMGQMDNMDQIGQMDGANVNNKKINNIDWISFNRKELYNDIYNKKNKDNRKDKGKEIKDKKYKFVNDNIEILKKSPRNKMKNEKNNKLKNKILSHINSHLNKHNEETKEINNNSNNNNNKLYYTKYNFHMNTNITP